MAKQRTIEVEVERQYLCGTPQQTCCNNGKVLYDVLSLIMAVLTVVLTVAAIVAFTFVNFLCGTGTLASSYVALTGFLISFELAKENPTFHWPHYVLTSLAFPMAIYSFAVLFYDIAESLGG